MEIGEFHWKDGWYFKREADGAVRVRKVVASHSAEVSATIPAAEWASIISHVAKGGEGPNYQAAVEFHGK